jgi:transposase-like protein
MEGQWDTRDYWVVVSTGKNKLLIHIFAHRNKQDAWAFFNTAHPEYLNNGAVLVDEIDARDWFEALKERFA